MNYEIRRAGRPDAIATLPDFRRACKWCIRCASAFNGGDFEIWRVEKRGRNVTTELEARYTLDD